MQTADEQSFGGKCKYFGAFLNETSGNDVASLLHCFDWRIRKGENKRRGTMIRYRETKVSRFLRKWLDCEWFPVK